MGHKTNALSYRLGYTKKWETSSVEKKRLYRKYLLQDLLLYTFIKNFFINYTTPKFSHTRTRNKKGSGKNKSAKTNILENVWLDTSISFSHLNIYRKTDLGLKINFVDTAMEVWRQQYHKYFQKISSNLTIKPRQRRKPLLLIARNTGLKLLQPTTRLRTIRRRYKTKSKLLFKYRKQKLNKIHLKQIFRIKKKSFYRLYLWRHHKKIGRYRYTTTQGLYNTSSIRFKNKLLIKQRKQMLKTERNIVMELSESIKRKGKKTKVPPRIAKVYIEKKNPLFNPIKWFVTESKKLLYRRYTKKKINQGRNRRKYINLYKKFIYGNYHYYKTYNKKYKQYVYGRTLLYQALHRKKSKKNKRKIRKFTYIPQHSFYMGEIYVENTRKELQRKYPDRVFPQKKFTKILAENQEIQLVNNNTDVIFDTQVPKDLIVISKKHITYRTLPYVDKLQFSLKPITRRHILDKMQDSWYARYIKYKFKRQLIKLIKNLFIYKANNKFNNNFITEVKLFNLPCKVMFILLQNIFRKQHNVRKLVSNYKKLRYLFKKQILHNRSRRVLNKKCYETFHGDIPEILVKYLRCVPISKKLTNINVIDQANTLPLVQHIVSPKIKTKLGLILLRKYFKRGRKKLQESLKRKRKLIQSKFKRKQKIKKIKRKLKKIKGKIKKIKQKLKKSFFKRRKNIKKTIRRKLRTKLKKLPFSMFNGLLKRKHNLFLPPVKKIKLTKILIRGFQSILQFSQKKQLFFLTLLKSNLLSLLQIPFFIPRLSLMRLFNLLLVKELEWKHFKVYSYKKILTVRFLLFNTANLALASSIKSFDFTPRTHIAFIGMHNRNLTAKHLVNFIILKLGQYFTIQEILRPLVFELRRSSALNAFRIIVAGRLTRKERAAYMLKQRGNITLNTKDIFIDYAADKKIMRFGLVGIKIFLNLDLKKIKPFSYIIQFNNVIFNLYDWYKSLKIKTELFKKTMNYDLNFNYKMKFNTKNYEIKKINTNNYSIMPIKKKLYLRNSYKTKP